MNIIQKLLLEAQKKTRMSPWSKAFNSKYDKELIRIAARDINTPRILFEWNFPHYHMVDINCKIMKCRNVIRRPSTVHTKMCPNCKRGNIWVDK